MDNQLPAEVVADIETLSRSLSDKRYEEQAVNFEYLEYEAGVKDGATEYATKLHQAEQEIAQLKRWKMEAVELIGPIHAYVHKNIEKSLGQCSVKLVLDRCKMYEQARTLLTDVLVVNEMWGDLPGTFIEKVKTFLDGTK